jgi:hypothetical protein
VGIIQTGEDLNITKRERNGVSSLALESILLVLGIFDSTQG